MEKLLWGGCMSGFKGVGTGIMVLTLVFVFMLFFFLMIKIYIWDAKVEANIVIEGTIQSEDQGAKMISFLAMKKSGLSYVEVLGSTAAENHRDHISKELGEVGESLEHLGYMEKLTHSIYILGERVIGKVAVGKANKYEVEIPLPGLERGSMVVEEV